jgi:hypothetical protein
MINPILDSSKHVVKWLQFAHPSEFAYYKCAYKVLLGTLASHDIIIRKSDLKVFQN